jgi:hypothetical protein
VISTAHGVAPMGDPGDPRVRHAEMTVFLASLGFYGDSAPVTPNLLDIHHPRGNLLASSIARSNAGSRPSFQSWNVTEMISSGCSDFTRTGRNQFNQKHVFQSEHGRE